MATSEVLKAHKRAQLGSSTARVLRAEGQIPSNLQGDGDHVDFSIDMRQFLSTRRHHTHLYDIDIDGNVESAVVRELQWDTFGDNIIHVEFKRVQRGVVTESEVALSWVGQPKGGILNHLIEHITVSCIPSLIPDSIEVRVDTLEMGGHLKAVDIVMPEGLTLVTDPTLEIATVMGASSAEVESDEESEDDGGDDDGAGSAGTA